MLLLTPALLLGCCCSPELLALPDEALRADEVARLERASLLDGGDDIVLFPRRERLLTVRELSMVLVGTRDC